MLGAYERLPGCFGGVRHESCRLDGPPIENRANVGADANAIAKGPARGGTVCNHLEARSPLQCDTSSLGNSDLNVDATANGTAELLWMALAG